MNPGPIRAAIADALGQREAFAGVTIARYPRPPDGSDTAELVFGGVPEASVEIVDMAGSSQIEDYEIAMALWWGGVGATDDDFAEAEGKAVAMLADFRSWLGEVGNGKRLGVEGVVVDDMEITGWDLGFRIVDTTEAEIQFTLAISEVVT